MGRKLNRNNNVQLRVRLRQQILHPGLRCAHYGLRSHHRHAGSQRALEERMDEQYSRLRVFWHPCVNTLLHSDWNLCDRRRSNSSGTVCHTDSHQTVLLLHLWVRMSSHTVFWSHGHSKYRNVESQLSKAQPYRTILQQRFHFRAY